MPHEKSKIIEQVEDDHAALKTALKQIEAECGRTIQSDEFNEWKRGFIKLLRKFNTNMLNHFDLEEDGGYLAEIIIEAPHTIKDVKNLEAEHEQFICDLSSVILVLKQMERYDPNELQDCRGKLTLLIKSLREHEKTENTLVQNAYCTDIGYPS
jgi:hemerythrin-like domain-containing protein